MNAEIEPAAETKTIAIDLRESWHADWWARYFGVTRTELLAAIMEAGTDVYAVRSALGK